MKTFSRSGAFQIRGRQLRPCSSESKAVSQTAARKKKVYEER
jgi:hypothetical protein